MRTLAITQNVTLDGSVEMLGDWFDAQGQGDSTDLVEHMHREDRDNDAFLVGRETFEAMRGYWPQQTDDTTGVTEHLNRVAKFVVSSTLTEPRWEGTTVLDGDGDVIDQVRALKAQPGRDIVVTGSIRLCHTLIEAGLVDQYRLFTYPVVQGRGRRLFPDGYEVLRLRLLQATSFSCGITYARYAPA